MRLCVAEWDRSWFCRVFSGTQILHFVYSPDHGGLFVVIVVVLNFRFIYLFILTSFKKNLFFGGLLDVSK